MHHDLLYIMSQQRKFWHSQDIASKEITAFHIYHQNIRQLVLAHVLVSCIIFFCSEGDSDQPIWLTNVNCPFSYSCLSFCASCSSSEVTNCQHSEDIYISCCEFVSPLQGRFVFTSGHCFLFADYSTTEKYYGRFGSSLSTCADDSQGNTSVC